MTVTALNFEDVFNIKVVLRKFGSIYWHELLKIYQNAEHDDEGGSLFNCIEKFKSFVFFWLKNGVTFFGLQNKYTTRVSFISYPKRGIFK